MENNRVVEPWEKELMAKQWEEVKAGYWKSPSGLTYRATTAYELMLTHPELNRPRP